MRFIVAIFALAVSLNAQVLIDPYVFAGNNNLRTGLEAFWKFDELSGNAIDSSGNEHHLTQAGTIEATDGRIDGGRLFSGADNSDYFITPAADWNAFGSTNFTIAFWFRPGVPVDAAGEWLVAKQDADSGERDWEIFLDESLVYVDGFAVKVIGPDFALSLQTDIDSGPLPSSQWYFVHLRRTDDDWVLGVGIDGDPTPLVYADSTPHAGITTPSRHPLVVGAYYQSTLTPPIGEIADFNGTIDHMGIWIRDLSDCELQKLFEATKYRKFDSRPCQ